MWNMGPTDLVLVCGLVQFRLHTELWAVVTLPPAVSMPLDFCPGPRTGLWGLIRSGPPYTSPTLQHLRSLKERLKNGSTL